MRKTNVILLLALLLTLLCGAFAMAEDASAEMDEWTVMFYFCGSDLESKYGYATGNLEEISMVQYPDNYLNITVGRHGVPEDVMTATEPGKVNVLIETGGCSQWHARELNMDVDPAALQRWRYNVYPMSVMGTQKLINGYELMETLPLNSMADPDTLADFIRWGKATCPAKKYALILWDHGDGARTGLFIDELFDRDVMYLYELKQALADADTHLDTVIIDACLMANLETAWAIHDSADWMVASEENVPGKGTAMGDWLQQLFCNPWGDGEWLGRCVCDTTAIKYADENEGQARSALTWSLIDLSVMDKLIESTEGFFRQINDALIYDPEVANLYMRDLFDAAEYGDGMQNMREFGELVYRTDLIHYMDPAVRSRVLKALTDAVAYSVRGSGHSEARGLTFCYPADFSENELEHYAKNFPLPEYLAFIDAVSPWNAPDWVYESARRLPDIDDIKELQLNAKKRLNAKGMPGVLFRMPEPNLNEVYYRLYRLDDEMGEVLYLGRTNCVFESTEDFDQVFFAADPMHWPSIDGELICMDMVKLYAGRKIYNVPVIIDGQTNVLRLNRNDDGPDDTANPIDEYEVLGAWEGENESGDLLNRSLKPLTMLVNQEYRLLYPIESTMNSDRVIYQQSAPLTMYRRLDVEEIPLPAGTYYLEYEICDMYMRKALLDRIEIRWDGETMTFPQADQWEDEDWFNVAERRVG